MSSDADLSTDDLARPGGMREQEAAGTADRTGVGRSGGIGDTLEEGTATGGAGARPGAMGGEGATRRDASTVPEMEAVPGPDTAAGRDIGSRQDLGDQHAATNRDNGGGMPARTMDHGAPSGTSAGGDETGDVSLVDPADGERFRQRWNDAQARFVDDPREAVQTADGLVAELMQTLASSFSDHKGRLESAWQSGQDPDTEELRQALQRYRSFFDRLLSA